MVRNFEKGLEEAKKLQARVAEQAAKEAGRVQLHINAEAEAHKAKVPAGKKKIENTKHVLTILQWNV